jgi:type II secretory pathway component PulM
MNGRRQARTRSEGAGDETNGTTSRPTLDVAGRRHVLEWHDGRNGPADRRGDAMTAVMTVLALVWVLMLVPLAIRARRRERDLQARQGKLDFGGMPTEPRRGGG